MTFADKPRILLVDDDRAVLEMLRELFVQDYRLVLASSGSEALERVRETDDILAVVMDIKMAGMDGITAARKIKETAPELPIIFHTGYPGDFDEDDINAREKPFDYVLKGESISKLTRSVRNAAETSLLKKDNVRLGHLAELNYGLVGQSSGMQRVYKRIRKIAESDSKVMILGETGTGKELVARAIHNNGRRRLERLAIFNCNHRSPDLVESELFGHIRGSFTGAVADRVGLFEYADNGTVMLDEIGDLDITTQGKILRVLETGEYQRIGSPEIQKTNIRIICATNRNLEEMVAQRRFREDLYYRLKGVKIVLPPLRDRKNDIPLLVDRFKARFVLEQGYLTKVFDPSAIDALMEYDWPGNVRQLLDTVESLIMLADSDVIVATDIHEHLSYNYGEGTGNNGSARTLSERVREFRSDCIMNALNETGNNVSAAARLLGVDRSNLRKMIVEHGITLSKISRQRKTLD
jgi:two-component system nitrogen regulation response regulator NtrX